MVSMCAREALFGLAGVIITQASTCEQAARQIMKTKEKDEL